jgi:hypothetical protein
MIRNYAHLVRTKGFRVSCADKTRPPELRERKLRNRSAVHFEQDIANLGSASLEGRPDVDAGQLQIPCAACWKQHKRAQLKADCFSDGGIDVRVRVCEKKGLGVSERSSC